MLRPWLCCCRGAQNIRSSACDSKAHAKYRMHQSAGGCDVPPLSTARCSLQVQSPGAVLRKDVTTLLSELAITRAYMRLLFASPNEDGLKTVSLARIGKYEVLLAESARPWLADSPPLWLQLYAHDIDAAIDSSCARTSTRW